MKLKQTKNKKKTLMVIFSIAIIAVMIVPTLYSSIYLGSVWDVYGKLDSVPVAFVNLDKSVTKDGKEYAVGKKVEDNLKDNKKVGWKFVSYEDAMNGVKGTKYYALVEIPEDFSQKIADAQDGNFKNPEIIYVANKGRNFVFSQVSSKAADSIRSEVNSSIQKEVSKALVDSLYNVKVSLKDAGDGAGELQSGTQQLLDGSKNLVAGIQNAADGSVKLESGLKTAADSTAKLQNGTQKLIDGSDVLSNGLSSAASGSHQLLTGLKSINNGQSHIVSGSSTLIDGLKTLKSGLTQPNNQVSLIVRGASDLNTKTDTIAQGAGQLDTSVSSLKNAVDAADSYLHDSNLSDSDKLNAAMSILDQLSKKAVGPNGETQLAMLANSTDKLAGSLQQLKTGTQQISDGVTSLTTGISDSQSKAASALDKLISGAEGIKGGSSNILSGLNTVTDKTGTLANGLSQLSSGSVSLKDGLTTVNNGNISLKEGLITATESTGKLSDGLNTLSNGSNSLKDGLQSANYGSIKLKDGLDNGYNKMDTELKFNSENMSQFISEPVTLKDNSINNVYYYGEGLAPYFISMSLWLGAMFISLAFSIAKSINIFKSKLMNSFMGKFIVGSALVAFQALMLSFIVIKALGINPVSVPQFYLTNVLFSITFFSIIYGVSHAIGLLGGAVMFIVLLLQLSSSGGTFPIETAPAFYKIINKVIPMTYSINSLRMTISGINQSLLNHNILIMVIFIVIFLCGGYFIGAVINHTKIKKQTTNDTMTA